MKIQGRISKLFSKKKETSCIDLWVENEIELAIKKEVKSSGHESECVRMCYDSAKEAYLALLGKGHSGLSISFTKFILNRLIDRKPLTSITEDDFNGVSCSDLSESFMAKNGYSALYQCPRYSSLFKKIGLDGKTSYSDNQRVETIDRNLASCHCGSITKMIDDMFPISLPYWPANKYKVYTAEFTYNKDSNSVSIDSGIYNAMYVGFIVTPDQKVIRVDKFEFEDEVTDFDKELLKESLRAELVNNGLMPVSLDLNDFRKA